MIPEKRPDINLVAAQPARTGPGPGYGLMAGRSEEHTSELQSHSFISYAVFCLKKKKKTLLCASLSLTTDRRSSRVRGARCRPLSRVVRLAQGDVHGQAPHLILRAGVVAAAGIAWGSECRNPASSSAGSRAIRTSTPGTVGASVRCPSAGLGEA